jgi:hypothetical protein
VAPETVIIAAAVVCTGFVLAMVKLTRHFAAPQPISVTAEWLDELSIDTANLLRLLDEERPQSFRSQPDFTPKMATKLRIQRCQLFHKRLRHPKNDFKLICMALKVIIVESKQDRPDLAWVLVRNQMTYAYGMMMVRFQLVRYRYGL